MSQLRERIEGTVQKYLHQITDEVMSAMRESLHESLSGSPSLSSDPSNAQSTPASSPDSSGRGKAYRGSLLKALAGGKSGNKSVKPGAKSAKPGVAKPKRILPCIAAGCKNLSKGPRFRYLCDEHKKASKKQSDAWRAAKLSGTVANKTARKK